MEHIREVFGIEVTKPEFSSFKSQLKHLGRPPKLVARERREEQDFLAQFTDDYLQLVRSLIREIGVERLSRLVHFVICEEAP